MDDSGSTDDDYVPLDPTFLSKFSIVKVSLLAALWSVAIGYAAVQWASSRHSILPAPRTWRLYGLLCVALTLAFLREALFCIYMALLVSAGASPPWQLASVGLVLDNLAYAAFAATLIAIASGYCVTREDLGEYSGRVFCVGSTVLICGLTKDLIFQAFSLQQSAPGAKDLTTMDSGEVMLFIFGTLAWACAIVLAWVYTFEAVGEETETLKTAYEALQRQPPLAPLPNTAAAGMPRVPAGGRGRGRGDDAYAYLDEDDEDVEAGLVAGSGNGAAHGGGGGGGEGALETVADRIEYTSKMTLLKRFGYGVSTYLSTTICLAFLPAFILTPIQTVVSVLQFTAYILFITWLLFVFRPQHESPYLLAGRDDAEAETTGHANLVTQIAMVETAMGGRSRANGGGGGGGPATRNGYDSDGEQDEEALRPVAGRGVLVTARPAQLAWAAPALNGAHGPPKFTLSEEHDTEDGHSLPTSTPLRDGR